MHYLIQNPCGHIMYAKKDEYELNIQAARAIVKSIIKSRETIIILCQTDIIIELINYYNYNRVFSLYILVSSTFTYILLHRFKSVILVPYLMVQYSRLFYELYNYHINLVLKISFNFYILWTVQSYYILLYRMNL